MSKSVILPYDQHWEALKWAKANCRSYITNQSIAYRDPMKWGNTRIEYFFSDERDATMFRLRWSK